MAGNTYKWLGSSSNNDAATAANWLIEAGGTFSAAATAPGSLDTITIDNGGTVNDSTGDLPLIGETISFAGSGGTLDLGTIDVQRQNRTGAINVAAGTTAAIVTTGSVTLDSQVAVAGSGAVLNLTAGGAVTLNNAAFAELGGVINIATTSGGSVEIDGGLVAYGGSVDVAATPGGSGVYVIGGGGAMTLQGLAQTGAVVDFIDGTGTLSVAQTGTVGLAIVGFQKGDTIDLTALNDASLQTITVNGNFTTLTDGTNTVVLPLPDEGFTAGSFNVANDGSGHVLLTTTHVVADWLNGANGDWGTAAAWSTNAVPASSSDVVIANLGNTFDVTATNEAAHSVELTAPNGMLSVAGSLTVGTAILDLVGTVSVGPGATVTARAFNQIGGGGGTLDMVGGAQMTLTGGTVIPGLGTLALNADGLVALDAATLNAGAGAVVVGDNTGGNLVVQDHATLTGASGVVTGQGVAQIQDGGLWAASGDLTIGGGNAGTQPTVMVQQGTSLHTGGSLTVGATLVLAGGTLDVTGGGSANAASFMVNGGSIFVDGASVLNIGTAGPGVATGVVVDAGATATFDNGSLLTPLTDNGSVLVNSFANLGSTLTGAGTITIAAGASLMIETGVVWTTPIDFAGPGTTLVLSDPSADHGALLGVAPAAGSGLSNTIDINTLTYNVGNGITYQSGPGVLLINGGGDGTLQVGSGLSQSQFAMRSDGASGTDIVISAAPCYAEGTRLATPAGEAPVEALRPGDAVLALQGEAWVARRVRWVGRTTVDLARHPQPDRAAPVRIAAHAFAPGVPSRDLWLSPEHAVFVDGALVPAAALLNGATVTQEFPPRVTYLHVELDAHSVLCAEGLAAESYLDTGNRGLFAGEAGTRPLHPDLLAAAAWDERACAPLLLGGARVAAVHGRLLARAQALGAALSGDAGLVIEQDGRLARLCSRSFVPAWLGLGPDRRRLGVAVASVRLDGRPLPARAFGPGWHAPEPGLRWTEGDALVYLPRDGRLVVRCAPVPGRYWTEALRAA